MRLGIIANTTKQQVRDILPSFLRWLKEERIMFTIASDLADLVDLSSCDVTVPRQVPDKADFILSFGGDGTFLQTARLVAPRSVPIIGVNLGRFGYLAEVGIGQLRQRIIDLRNGDYSVQERMMLQAYTDDNFDTPFAALNDIVIDKGDFPRAIRIETALDGENLNTFIADGLIVATPTGSTGHSLSVGGPILEPCVDGIIINPISPHTLAHRPLVVSGHRSDNSVHGDDPVRIVGITAFSESNKILVVADGQEVMRLQSGETLKIHPAPFTAKIVMFPGYSFYSLLRNKLQWSSQISSSPTGSTDNSDLLRQDDKDV